MIKCAQYTKNIPSVYNTLSTETDRHTISLINGGSLLSLGIQAAPGTTIIFYKDSVEIPAITVGLSGVYQIDLENYPEKIQKFTIQTVFEDISPLIVDIKYEVNE